MLFFASSGNRDAGDTGQPQSGPRASHQGLPDADEVPHTSHHRRSPTHSRYGRDQPGTYTNRHKRPGAVMMPTLSSLVAPEVVFLTVPGATGYKRGIILGFHLTLLAIWVIFEILTVRENIKYICILSNFDTKTAPSGFSCTRQGPAHPT